MAAPPPVSHDVLNQEANARFWSQTGYRPGQKLDPKNPTDKAMMPVWMDIFRKVKAEAAAGTLVTTYDHPAVAQSLSDAGVADKVAAMHVEAAARATDPRDVQANTSAAATAAQVSAQKTSEAAASQPPTASPALIEAAKHEAAHALPHPHAPAADQLAHAQIQTSTKASSPDRRLVEETNNRFWQRTHYKPGQKLDMSIAEDRRQSKVWMQIFHEVQREAREGGPVVPSPGPVSQPWPPTGPTVPFGPPHVQPPSMGPSQMQFPMGPSQVQFPTGPRPPWPYPHPPRGPGRPMGPRPGGFPSGPLTAPPGAPEGMQTAPPEGDPGAPDLAPPDVPLDGSAPTKKPSILKFVAIGAAVIAGGGLIYYVGTRKPARGRATSSRSRTAAPSASYAPTRAWRP
jgi:hypothetical protein